MIRVLSSLAFASTLRALDVQATMLPTALLLPRIRGVFSGSARAGEAAALLERIAAAGEVLRRCGLAPA